MPTIKIKSADDKILIVEKDIAKLSLTLKILLDSFNDCDENDDNEEIPLPNVNFNVLEKVVEWCSKIRNNSEKDKKIYLCKMDNRMLTDIILAADYLQIEELINMGSLVVAERLMDTSDNRG